MARIKKTKKEEVVEIEEVVKEIKKTTEVEKTEEIINEPLVNNEVEKTEDVTKEIKVVEKPTTKIQSLQEFLY